PVCSLLSLLAALPIWLPGDARDRLGHQADVRDPTAGPGPHDDVDRLAREHPVARLAEEGPVGRRRDLPHLLGAQRTGGRIAAEDAVAPVRPAGGVATRSYSPTPRLASRSTRVIRSSEPPTSSMRRQL